MTTPTIDFPGLIDDLRRETRDAVPDPAYAAPMLLAAGVLEYARQSGRADWATQARAAVDAAIAIVEESDDERTTPYVGADVTEVDPVDELEPEAA